jgi:hypothetical protein
MGSALIVAAFAFAAQVRINYQDQDFTLKGFDTFSATLEDRSIGFEGRGKPLSIEILSSGTLLSGTDATGRAVKDAGGAYFLQTVSVNGDAVLSVDTQLAYEYVSRNMESSKRPDVVTKTELRSSALKYSGTAADGRTDFPAALIIDTTSFSAAASRALHLTGTSGFITMSLKSAGSNALRTGEIVGPVTYSGKSDALSAPGGPPQTTTFQGKADNLKFDFTTEPRTLTLTGNVTLDAKGTAATGEISADTVVVTLDANLKPVKIDIAGSPAKTTMRQESPR